MVKNIQRIEKIRRKERKEKKNTHTRKALQKIDAITHSMKLSHTVFVFFFS
jgi:hypothetical protein